VPAKTPPNESKEKQRKRMKWFGGKKKHPASTPESSPAKSSKSVEAGKQEVSIQRSLLSRKNSML